MQKENPLNYGGTINSKLESDENGQTLKIKFDNKIDVENQDI